MCKTYAGRGRRRDLYRHLHLGREHRPHPDRKDVVDPDPIEGIMKRRREGFDRSQQGRHSSRMGRPSRRRPDHAAPSRTAMVCTEGFRDVIEIRRANKEDLWDTYRTWQALHPAPGPDDRAGAGGFDRGGDPAARHGRRP